MTVFLWFLLVAGPAILRRAIVAQLLDQSHGETSNLPEVPSVNSHSLIGEFPTRRLDMVGRFR
jgi:hypothetical protein